MNSNFKFKLLSHLKAKKEGEGFTLIELLVVVIIIGVLAAVALPNLLGQVGKARETEAKNAMGTVNRTQQAYHFEKATFGPTLTGAELAATNVLGVIVPTSKYYNFAVTGGSTSTATASAIGISAASTVDNGAGQGTRDYGARIDFAAGAYNSAICQANKTGTTTAVPVVTTLACDAAGTAVK
jgi:type IV pilus assembly protein PilA